MYKYLVFEDEAKQVFVIRDIQLKDCVFGGSVGKIIEIERGIFKEPETEEEKNNSLYFLGMLINKRDEYLAKCYK
jgi:hypothetical protein